MKNHTNPETAAGSKKSLIICISLVCPIPPVVSQKRAITTTKINRKINDYYKRKNAPVFLNFEELCEKLKCSRHTAKDYIKAGKLKNCNPPQLKYEKMLFRTADVDYFLQDYKRK